MLGKDCIIVYNLDVDELLWLIWEICFTAAAVAVAAVENQVFQPKFKLRYQTF